MSAVLQRNHEGVVLDYADPTVQRQFHLERRPQPSDRERTDLLRAEKACRTILTMGELVYSDIAMTRLDDELRAVERALNLKRPQLGLQSAKAAKVAA